MKKRFVPIYSILAVAIILLGAFIPSCGGPARTFALTMAAYPPGSGMALDLTGGSPYTSGTVVNITAAPLGSYQFVKWTAPAGTFANANLAPTQFTMPAQNVTATANFRGPLDHFKCYNVTDASRVDKSVTLTDQFTSINATVGQAVWFANPTRKTHGQTVKNITNPDDHFTFYNITYAGGPWTWYVEVSNQFGNYTLTVRGPHMLAVPTQKVEPGNHRPPLSLDHFLVYQVVNGPLLAAGVSLNDQFGNETSVVVGETFLFANPVQKTVAGAAPTPILHPNEHLVFYKISNTQVSIPQVKVLNQFTQPTAPEPLRLGSPAGLLGVPSEKLDWGEELDHFKSYPISGVVAPINKAVRLKDQFVDMQANVTVPDLFCNPAIKQVGQEISPILNPDYHFTIYQISRGGPAVEYVVRVKNQFGTQDLHVIGPVALAVPTHKLIPGPHGPPIGLDHYLLYLVLPNQYVGPPVGLEDEFGREPAPVGVTQPYYFANPVQKTVGDVVFPIQNEMEHLVFYLIQGSAVQPPPTVLSTNQFVVEPTPYELLRSTMLAVPSLKLGAVPYQPP